MEMKERVRGWGGDTGFVEEDGSDVEDEGVNGTGVNGQ